MGIFSKIRKTVPKPFVSAIIPAAGQSSRMAGIPKILSMVGQYPVIAHTLIAFEACEDITEIIISAREEDILDIGDLCKALDIAKVKTIIRGGQTRTESVMAALMQMDERSQLAAIHDGARPCVTPELITSVVKEALRKNAAAPGVSVTDTLKELGKDGLISKTVDRSKYVQIQTPQCFEPSLIKGALTKASQENLQLTDDCSAVEFLGAKVSVVQGDYSNIKITTPTDLIIASAILASRNNEWSVKP